MAVTRGQLLLQELAAGKEFVFIMEEGLSSQSDGHCSGTDGKLQSQGGGSAKSEACCTSCRVMATLAEREAMS